MVQPTRPPRAALLSRSSGSFLLSAVLGVVAVACVLTFAADARAQSTGTVSKDQKTLADELPRIPPTPAEKGEKTFALQHGFRLELFAAEPQVASPVDACFDENGRMYVAEMRDYPFSWEPTKLNPAGGGKKDAGVIRLLEDTDGDGRADRSVIFADKLTWPTSVCCYQGGVFVLAPPHLHYFKDTDGDGRADVHQIVLSGFGRDNVQAVANCLKWSLDNRIVFAAGRNGGTLTHDGKKVCDIHGQDLSLDPATLSVSAVTGGEQFGLSFDDWGNRFVCNNSNHIEQVVLEERYLRRNPYFAASNSIRTIAKEGPAAPVFRRSPPEPWRVVRTRRRVSDPAMLRTLPFTEQFAVGYFTSAAGITIYRGDAYPAEFQGNAFIGDVGGNLVHRKTLRRDGPLEFAERADQDTEFLTSTDNWFRPVNFVNAPDGTLFLLDMYRETIEHPYSIPDDIKSHLDLQSGDDRGRIYRLVPPGNRKFHFVKLGGLSSRDLVGQLESSNAWNRETAQRLLVERHDLSVVSPLEQLVRESGLALGRLHALYALDGLAALKDRVLLAALADPEPRIRAHALRLCESRLKRSTGLLAAVVRMAGDRDRLVRFQLALSLGDAEPSAAAPPLTQLAQGATSDELLRSALLTSVAANADVVLLALLADHSFAARQDVAGLLGDLASVVGAQPDSGRTVSVLRRVFEVQSHPGAQVAVLRGIGQALSRRGLSISGLLMARSSDRGLKKAADYLFDRAAIAARDASRPAADRIAAIRLLGFAPFPQAAAVLPNLLSPQMSAELQIEAVAALTNQSDPGVARILIAAWRNLGPKLHREVIDGLVRKTDWLSELFAAIEARQIGAGEIDRDVKQLLMNHPNPKIRDRARNLFAADRPGNVTATLAAYRPALERTTRADRGRAIYERRCATCHRAGDFGHAVGPDLASVQNKSPADLLVAILDPNREAQPNYISYTLVTHQGIVHTGIIVAESAAGLTLRRADAKEDRILRTEIDELASTGKSLMPEGLDKDITPSEMADLIAFIKSLRPAPRK
ncbi:MAG TPA: PVC-type heme-binding CxxCH protein [Planctomycetaceae bacterium]|nr:PVC-type heme-binding CxxCH protein [Planctomycetaceae bacterium]